VERERIKRFAIDILGCGCEESVFESIDVWEDFTLACGVELSKKILIGKRLLIYIADVDKCAPDMVAAVIADGLKERETHCYNRLRLVIVTPGVEKHLLPYSDAFDRVKGRDDRTHIHIVKEGHAV